MFGKFALSCLLLTSLQAFCAQLGTVIVNETYIYLNADFDSPVIATAKNGETLQISNKPLGPFYKVRLKNNQLGWVSSVEVKIGKVDFTSETKKEKKSKPLASYLEEQNNLKAFAVSRYQGFFIQSSDWKEKTLGKTRKDILTFWGWNWTGFDTLVEGPFYIDSRLMLTTNPPKYYEKITGINTKALIFRAQTAFVSANPLGASFLFHYGIGASTTYSRIEATVMESGTKKSFTMEDINLGVVFPIGLSYRLGSLSTQIFFQYYLEKTQTTGLSLGLNWTY